MSMTPVAISVASRWGRGISRARGGCVRIALRFSDDVAIMNLSGRFLAGSDGPFLRKKMNDLIEAGVRKLLIDFAEVPYIDSTGLGFLAGARSTAKSAGMSLVLSGLNQHVKKILDDVQLTQFFVISKDESAGLAKLAKAPNQPSSSDAVPAKAPKARKRPIATPEQENAGE
jgi:anti-sigma B factor antagonist